MSEQIAVVGAGQMGNGIAHVCAAAGYDVLLNDVSEERIREGDPALSQCIDSALEIHRVFRHTTTMEGLLSVSPSVECRESVSMEAYRFDPIAVG